MTTLFFLIIAVFLVASLVLGVILAPIGDEDDEGFHFKDRRKS